MGTELLTVKISLDQPARSEGDVRT